MSARRRPWIRDQRMAVGLGLAGIALGWAALYDAYAGRGQDTPRPLRPITWW